MFSSDEFTHPVGSAHGLVIDAVALGRRQRGVPETPVALVVPHHEGLNHREAGRRQLGGDVVRRAQDGSVTKADRGRKTLQGLRGGAASFRLALLLHNKLVGAGKDVSVSVFQFWTQQITFLSPTKTHGALISMLATVLAKYLPLRV